MAVIRERRQINLSFRLPLLDVSDRLPCFPLPLPPSATTKAVTIPEVELERQGVLGHGNGGTVYKVQQKRTSKIYALKVVYGDGDLNAREQVCREMEILRKTDSPHVVGCYETYVKPCGDVEILMEYMDARSLDTVVRNKGSLLELEVTDISRQIESCNSHVGTCAYMSPERFDPSANEGGYDGFLSNIWSLGLTLMELFVGHYPYLPAGQKPNWTTLMLAICFGEPPVASDEFKNFMECCLQMEPSKRWTASQLLEHPFLFNSLGFFLVSTAVIRVVVGFLIQGLVELRCFCDGGDRTRDGGTAPRGGGGGGTAVCDALDIDKCLAPDWWDFYL
ncbi:NAD-dependent dihydropyrimidine dehydrogenase subunit PreA [Hibiscus syriacus]|uniref:mitogen-activated protein kinase kinase n=1 Tax=Hibiscus syriacus TaxID=106335 RepID=A0A6A2YRH6_HIBSY|nr:NAD-dependent dihydropyrimidine dehydrogenase subunit PreA [Hibiscus syriacus]